MVNFIKCSISVVLLLFSFTAFSINCSVDVAQFLVADKPYIDVNLRIDGNTCKFLEENGKYAASTLVEIYFKQENVIKAFEKYELSAIDQIAKGDMMDMRRFFIKAGGYDLEIKITDNNNANNLFEYKSKVIVKNENDVKISNALLLSKIEKSTSESPLVRNGVYMEALPYLFIGEDLKVVQIYQEIYTSKFTEEVLIHKIEFIKELKDENDLKSPPLIKYKKLGNENVAVVMSGIDVSNLTSGRYKVRTAVINKEKEELVVDELDVLIKNTMGDIKNIKDYDQVYGNTFVNEMDSAAVVYSLKAIVPVTNYKMMSTLNSIIEEGNLPSQKYYLYHHWNEAFPGFAGIGHEKYMNIAKVVDVDFNGSVGHGFQTDRGYIYLKYGKPSKFIEVIDEPNTPPYEIWYYNHLATTNQTDVRFIFYDPMQVNNFELLHSTCYGERSNPAWETLLYKFNQDERIGETIIATEVEDNWGRKAKRLFNEF